MHSARTVPRGVFSRARGALALWLTLVGLPCEAMAQPSEAVPSPLGLEDVTALARARRAEIVAARRRAEAFAQRPAIVAAPPDPMVMLSADHIPVMLHGVDASLMVQQDFPLSSLLGRRRLVAEADARRVESDVGRVALDVEAEAARYWWMLFERRGMVPVLDAQLGLLRQLVAAAMARYAAGPGLQADVLRAQAELARVEAQRASLDAEITAAEAMLNASVGRNAALALPALDATPPDEDPPSVEDIAQAALAARPELATMRAEQARSRAEVDVMRSMYAPMGFVRAGPAYTMSDGPGAMVMVGFTVPIWTSRLRAGVSEARAMVSMADADLSAMRTMVLGEALTARAGVLAARTRATAVREQVAPRTQQAAAAVLAGYAVGQLPLVSAVDALRARWEAQTEVVMTQAELGIARTRLSRALGRFDERPTR